jgi:hypothetical protein
MVAVGAAMSGVLGKVIYDGDGGETGIRTLDTLRYTRFPSVRLQPLGHLSRCLATCLNVSHRSAQDACAQIPAACRNAGFIQGRAASDHAGKSCALNPRTRPETLVVSMGRRNTQLRPTFIENKS